MLRLCNLAFVQFPVGLPAGNFYAMQFPMPIFLILSCSMFVFPCSLLPRFPIISLIDSAEKYAIIKTRLRSQGIMIDEFDLMIAATAWAGDYILVTDNVKHFQRIKDLRMENWIER